MKLKLSFCRGWGGCVGGWGMHSNFCVQPHNSVVAVLCCCWGCDNFSSLLSGGIGFLALVDKLQLSRTISSQYLNIGIYVEILEILKKGK